MATQAVCRSCRQPKHKLNKVESKIIKGHEIAICDTCIAKGFEPRSLIIMSLRTDKGNQEQVRHYVKERLYCGDEISLKETL